MIRKKILIVESEPFISMILEMHVEGVRYELIKAADGQSGMAKIDSEKPDLVLLDVALGNVNGCLLVQELRRRYDDTRLIPVIIFSDRPSVKNLFKPKDIQAFISKPVSTKELFEKIKEILKASEAERGLVPHALLVGFDWEAIRPIKEVLEKDGFEVDVAQDAHHALQTGITKNPKAIFVSSVLAGMDIWEFCRMIQQMPSLKDIPVVVYDMGGIVPESGDSTIRAARVISYDNHSQLQSKTRAFLEEHL